MPYNRAPMVFDRRTFLQGCAALALLPYLTACSEGEARAGWNFDAHNPVLGGPLGVCFDPSVIKDGDLYKMLFSWRDKRAIGYTESANGYEWSQPIVVLEADPSIPGQIEVNRPSFLRHGDFYYVWFTGQTADTSAIFYAASHDGRNWQRVVKEPVLQPVLPWEKAAVMAPNVLWDEKNGGFRMYYSAGEQFEPDCIGFAVGASGVKWARQPAPVFNADPDLRWERLKVTGADVHKVGDWYYMFYIGFADIEHANICVARSRDGITNWQRHPQNPILHAPGMLNPAAWNRDAIYKPSAILEQDRWLLFFNARRRYVEQIGLAVHPGADLGF